MKKMIILLLLFGSASSLFAQDVADKANRVKKLLDCVDIVNSHMQKVEGGAKLDKRIVRRPYDDLVEYIIDQKIILRRFSSGVRVEFTINADTTISGTLNNSTMTFTVCDSKNNELSGSYSEKNSKINNVIITKYSKDFTVADLDKINAHLFNIGIITGTLFIVY